MADATNSPAPLTGTPDSPAEPRFNWTKDAIACLVELYVDNQMFLTGTKKDARIFADLENLMAEAGYKCSARQLSSKLKNLRFEYRKIADIINGTGNAALTPHQIELKELLDPLFGDRPSTEPTVLVQSLPAAGASAAASEASSEIEDLADDKDTAKPKDDDKKVRAKRPGQKRKAATDQADMADSLLQGYKDLELERDTREEAREDKRMKFERETMLAMERERGRQQMAMMNFFGDMMRMMVPGQPQGPPFGPPSAPGVYHQPPTPQFPPGPSYHVPGPGGSFGGPAPDGNAYPPSTTAPGAWGPGPNHGNN